MQRSKLEKPASGSHRVFNLAAILIAMAVLIPLHPGALALLPRQSEPERFVAQVEEFSILTPVADQARASTASVTLKTLSATNSVPSTRENNSLQILPDGIEGRDALLFTLSLLEEGCRRLIGISNYTAIFSKQERVDGEICDGEVMQLKLRHEPFSVYMKWLVGDKGREVLYVEGQHDGKLLVKLGGWKGRLLPTLKLNPNGSRAMRTSRHPITQMGLLAVVTTLIENRREDLRRESRVRCRMVANQQFDQRDCFRYSLEYDRPQDSAIYRKSIVYIDKEYSLPIFIRNYAWPSPTDVLDASEMDNGTLIEHYTYSNIDLNAELADGDFNRTNTAYRFRR